MTRLHRLRFLCLSFLLLLTLTQCRPSVPTAIYFNPAGKDLLKFGNSYFEIGLDKTNGGIVYLLDKATGKQVSQGNLKGCLWSAVFSITYPTLDACSFGPGTTNEFRYSWSDKLQQLSLNYTPGAAAAKKAAVIVTFKLSKDKWFDLQLTFENHWGYALQEVSFPADLLLGKDARSEALLPILPGVVLGPGYFQQGKDYETAYMGYPGVFADFMAYSSENGSFALYSTFEEQRFVPVKLGFHFNDCFSGSVCYTHRFQASAKNGSTWTTPRLRVWISASRLDTINAFRSDDGLADSPALSTKLGVLFDQVSQSPLYKADASLLGLPFKDYATLLTQIPYPGILHLLGFGPDGFDRRYPDFLPPGTQFGSTQDLVGVFKKAQTLGFINMPYINPTWWDGASPTLQNLPAPLMLADVVAQSEAGSQLEECYGCPDNPHRGYVVSPYVPFVQQRLAQLMQQMKKDLPSDLIFEDQVGARANQLDYNPASPSPQAYTQGWIEHTRTYASDKLMTEDGFDALVKTEIGFHGSILLQERQGLTDGFWGKGNWTVYPFATLAARDKVLFYQLDLAPETFTNDKATLAWNTAMGYNLSYDLYASDFGGGAEDSFINVVGAFQKYVFAHYAGERITNFSNLQAKVTQTAFENYTAITNWDANNPYPSDEDVLAPSGVLVTARDGSLTAGIFTAFHGAPLSGGDHYLIESKSEDALSIRQPMGADTDLTVRLQPGWNPLAALEVWAYTIDGHRIGKTPFTIHDNTLTFHYSNIIAGTPAAYYQIEKP